MPNRFIQEVGRIMRLAHGPSGCDLDEVAALLTELQQETESDGYTTLAELIGRAATEAARLRAERPVTSESSKSEA